MRYNKVIEHLTHMLDWHNELLGSLPASSPRINYLKGERAALITALELFSYRGALDVLSSEEIKAVYSAISEIRSRKDPNCKPSKTDYLLASAHRKLERRDKNPK